MSIPAFKKTIKSQLCESTYSVKINQSTKSNCNPAIQLRLKLEVIG